MVVTVLRTHWKKSVFFTLAAGYGLNRAKVKLEEKALMREMCREAADFGRAVQPLHSPMFNVTVILNPAASKGSAKNYYEKYCAPILHLAGLKVSLESQYSNLREFFFLHRNIFPPQVISKVEKSESIIYLIKWGKKPDTPLAQCYLSSLNTVDTAPRAAT